MVDRKTFVASNDGMKLLTFLISIDPCRYSELFEIKSSLISGSGMISPSNSFWIILNPAVSDISILWLDLLYG